MDFWMVILTSLLSVAALFVIANLLAQNLTENELNLLGVILTQLGDTILTIATQKSICCK